MATPNETAMVVERATGRGYISQRGAVLLGNVLHDLTIARNVVAINEGIVTLRVAGVSRVGSTSRPRTCFMLMESDVPHAGAQGRSHPQLLRSEQLQLRT